MRYLNPRQDIKEIIKTCSPLRDELELEEIAYALSGRVYKKPRELNCSWFSFLSSFM